jgi:hypothetical protein
MKKNALNLLLLVIITLFLNSCAPTKTTTSTAKTIDVYGAGVVHLPVVVELEVNQEKFTTTVSGTATVDQLKNEALIKALKETKADVFVEPTYDVVINGMNKTVIIKGYPAFYKNFRTIVKDDVELLDIGVLQKAKTVQGTTQNETVKGKTMAAVIMTAAGIIATVLIISAFM